ncbi:response regulator [candidate division KSB1 bacterium]|nr:response regulator [candidate division KSB1 bacterium]
MKLDLQVQAQSKVECSNSTTISQPRFEHITISHGLSQGLVSAIYQDSKGFMWFGTMDGLNHYDGYNFRIFRNDPFDSTSISGNYITSIIEDQFGRLWIGTYFNGLNCFDPATETCRRFLHDPDNVNSLSSNQISVICEDVTQDKNQNTTLWIGTNYGLNRLVLRESGGLVLNEAGMPVPLGSISTSLNTGSVEGKTSRNKAGINSTTDYTITNYFFNPEDSSSLSNDEVWDLLIDRSNNLWIATRNGLNKLDLRAHKPNQPEQFHCFLPASENKRTELENYCSALFESSDGSLWVSMGRSLWKLDIEENRTGRFQNKLCLDEIISSESMPPIANDICQDQKGLLWLPTSYGLIIFNPTTNSFQLFQPQKDIPSSLNYSALLCIFKDRSHLIWIGTAGFGLNKYDPYKEVFQTFFYNIVPEEQTLDINPANYIRELRDKRFVFMDRQTFLFDFDLRSGAYQLHRVIDRPAQVMVDFTKVGWVMLGDKLVRCDPESQTFQDIIPDSMKNSLHLMIQFEDGNGDIWAIGTYQKKIILICWDRDRQSIFSNLVNNPESIEYPRNIFTDGFRDQNGIFWLTSTNGLYRIDISTASLWIYHKNPRNRRSLNQNNLKTILPDPVFPDRFLWIGTNGGGLNRFEKGAENFTHYTEKDGLPNNVVYGILADARGDLWMSSNRGIAYAVLDPKTREIVSFKNYDERDGLQGDEFNTFEYYQNERGDMFFAGTQGVTVFHPDSIIRNPQTPPVVITGFQIHQQLVIPGSPGSPLHQIITATEKITLPHSDNEITFEFVALDFANPEKNLLSYKLEGLNQDWSPPKNKRLTAYTNLDPGDYVFRVRGSNSHGVWNEVGASVKITITPPWWRTWWAYSVYFLLILAMIYGLRRYESSRREAKHKYELEHVETKKLLESDQMKSRFFANISHEFRTPLTLILGPLENFLNRLKDKKDQQDLTLMHRNAKRLLKLINELLDLSRLESGQMKLQVTWLDIIKHLKYSLTFFESAAENKGIKLKFNTEHKTIFGYFDADKLQKIFENLIANAINFTPEGGEVRVECGLSNSDFGITHPPLQSINTNKGIRGGGEEFRNPKSQIVNIIISDNGVGIPKDRLSKIFDRFYQVDDSSTRKSTGTGIGLALTKELVELHHGAISVESKPGKGTTFFVKLLLGKDHLKKRDIIEEPHINVQKIPTGDKKPFVEDKLLSYPQVKQNNNKQNGFIFEMEKIDNEMADMKLFQDDTIVQIIEDHADMRKYIRSLLPKAYKVIEAKDGDEGIKKALLFIPDLIICDVMMPGMDGYQVCDELKKNDKTSHVPFILLTAKAEQKDKLQGYESGADSYIIKPFYADELLVQVNNLIELRRKLAEKFSSGQFPNTTESTIFNKDRQFISSAIAVVEEKMNNPEFSIEDLAKELGMSYPQLHRKIKALTNETPTLFIRSARMRQAAEFLKEKEHTISEVAFRVGFEDANYFARIFKKHYGMSPREFMKE